MQQKGVVWVKIPFSNHEEDKLRPALVISNSEYNARNLDVLICAITSNLEKRPYSVFIPQNDFSKGELPFQSKIKADKILRVEKS